MCDLMNLWKIMEFALAIFLIILALLDIRENKIPVIACVLAIVISCLFTVLELAFTEASFLDVVIRTVPGLMAILIAVVSRNAIGLGDGLMLLTIGMLLGVKRTIIVIMIALFLGCIFSVGLMIFKKVNGKYELPFVPFIAAGVLFLKVGEFV